MKLQEAIIVRCPRCKHEGNINFGNEYKEDSFSLLHNDWQAEIKCPKCGYTEDVS
jgi:predicted RNA-binding Zn-ribbon protein involved in translation (DUF1610 family)